MVWLYAGQKKAPPMGRPSRQAGLFERYSDELAELMDTELDGQDQELA